MDELPGPKPWFRSFLFGFGLIGLLGLLWAWWDSGSWSTGGAWRVGNRVVGLHQDHGQVQLVFDEVSPKSTEPRGWHGSRERIEMKEERLGPLPLARGVGRITMRMPAWGYRFDRILVGHWMIGIGYLVAWIGTLVFWQTVRRRRWLLARRMRTTPG